MSHREILLQNLSAWTHLVGVLKLIGQNPQVEHTFLGVLRTGPPSFSHGSHLTFRVFGASRCGRSYGHSKSVVRLGHLRKLEL